LQEALGLRLQKGHTNANHSKIHHNVFSKSPQSTRNNELSKQNHVFRNHEWMIKTQNPKTYKSLHPATGLSIPLLSFFISGEKILIYAFVAKQISVAFVSNTHRNNKIPAE
jgi:hypothetical protein